MKPPFPKKANLPNLKLQKIKNKKYYFNMPGLKVPIILNESLFKKWKKSNLLG